MKNAATFESAPARKRTSTLEIIQTASRITRRSVINSHYSPTDIADLGRIKKILMPLLGSEKGPSITFVYQDAETHEWAKEAYERMVKLAGDGSLRATWWKINELAAPGVLAAAVSGATRADLIVVASRAEGLPLPFYVWVNLWWPHRGECPGALLALVATAPANAPRAGRVGDYLRLVAAQSKMNFLHLEKNLASGERSTTLLRVNGHAAPGSIGAGRSSNCWAGHRHD
jgi:hypothetical protein